MHRPHVINVGAKIKICLQNCVFAVEQPAVTSEVAETVLKVCLPLLKKFFPERATFSFCTALQDRSKFKNFEIPKSKQSKQEAFPKDVKRKRVSLKRRVQVFVSKSIPSIGLRAILDAYF